jgi:hypothetical protein
MAEAKQKGAERVFLLRLTALIDRRKLHNLFLIVHVSTQNASCYNHMHGLQSVCMKI